jgi:hypothetical protein
VGAQVTYPVFIVCRDRVTCLQQLVAWLEQVRHADEVYLIDNASTYPPLLEYYEQTPHTVLRAGGNFGHKVGWTLGTIHRHARGRRFIYTDPDVLPVDDCPPDAVERMAEVFDRDGNAAKVGFSIKIDDLPPWCRDGIQDWEAKYWYDLDGMVGAYRAPIDTTFALYNGFAGRRFKYRPAYRLPEPYTVRHLPWYVDPSNLSDEDEYYRAHADPTVSNWARYVLDSVEVV